MTEQKLTQGRIVREAVALLRHGGLAAVSLRSVALRLSIRAPSLYWHIKSKEILYGLMCQAIFRSCLKAIPRCTKWQQWLREFGLSLWQAQEKTPDIRRLLVMAPVDPKERDACVDIIMASLTELGFDARLVVTAQQSVQALVTGWTTLGMGEVPHVESGETRFLQSLDALIEGWALLAGNLAVTAQTEARQLNAVGGRRRPSRAIS